MKIVEQAARNRSITLYDFEPTADRICDDVVRGLSARPKKLQPKYLYDEHGARLFERITELEAYYPTRTELSILRNHGEEIGDQIGRGVRLVEFGSGSGEKTWELLRHLRRPAAYIPVDISRAQLVAFALEVADAYPDMAVLPVCADYTREFTLPLADGSPGCCVAFFPGSTIGNFEPDEARAFLCRVRRLVGADGGLLIGVDLLKNVAVIERAYNDPEGVTAEFNLNLLTRINRECGADFDAHAFRHYAFFDETEGRIEMRLLSQREQSVRLPADDEGSAPERIRFDEGEPIITEYSQKYTLPSFAALATSAGWAVSQVWTDPSEWFAVILLR